MKYWLPSGTSSGNFFNSVKKQLDQLG